MGISIQKFKITFYFLFFFFSAAAQSEKLIYVDDRMEAAIHRDSVKLNELIANDAIIIHSNGLIENKREHIHNIMTGKIIYTQMDIKEYRIKLYKKTKVVTGIVEVTGKYEGKDYTVKLRFTELFRKQKHQWQLVNWQSTKMN